MSLMWKKDFPGFSPNLKRLQDWDLFLKIMKGGKTGKWINKILFTTPSREGITTDSISWEDSIKQLKIRHPQVG